MADQKKEPRTQAELEYDRLMGRRKGMSGGEFAGVGLQFGITIIVFALVGIWLDKRLGTSPWFVIGGVFGGAALGFWEMYRAMIGRRR